MASTFIDANGNTWTRSGSLCVCSDGRQMAIAPEMTDEYLLSIIDAPPPPPESVTMRQARLALHAAGKLAVVQAAIEGMPEPAKTTTQIWWDYSSIVERAQPLVAGLGAAAGLDAAGIDSLFVLAATL